MQPGPDDPYNQQQPPNPPGSYPPPPPAYGQQPDPYGQPAAPYGQPGYPPPAAAPSNGQGLAAMILGIISIPLACCGYGGIVLGILGIVFGVMGRRKADAGLATNRGQAQAGLICGAVGVVLGIVVLILSFSLQTFDWQHYIDSNS